MTGGLVGDNSGGITASYSTAKVTGDIVVGGLVGNNAGGGDLGTGIINTSYSTGLVTGTSEVGGLVGRFWGGMGGSVTLSFWDMEKSGQSSSAGGTGLTTAEMQDVNTYINAGWDFIGEVHNGTCDYWQMSPGDYPRFRYHIGDGPMMPEGLGTTQEPYLIRDARDLGTVWFKPSAHYRLESSLDLSQITWSMSVIPWFGGTFDGNGNVIRNLQIKGGGLLGLFGQLVSGAKISNLGLEASDINGSGSFVGGLVGESNFTSSITKSYSSGAINGDWYVGGLVGMNWRGDITSSYSTGTVRGNQCVGGLVGSNYGNIITSYSTVVTNGDQSIGGLVGMNWRGSITSCYSTGKVTGIRVVGGFTGGSSTDSSIIISFWDIETSGQLGSAGGIGKNTAEMQTAGTFLDAGWDFVDETDNGTEDIWWILEGQEYPRLWWEKTGN